jgi:uncharacterized protein YndB with AHSA1/START domain
MTKKLKIDTSHDTLDRRLTVERTYKASIEDLWELCTTRYGLELWWGPDGHSVKVSKLELRSGGDVEYAVTATEPAQIERRKSEGMPVTSEGKITFTEVAPRRHFAYQEIAPGSEPYVVSTDIELHTIAHGTSMVVRFDPMHDPAETQRAVTSWEAGLSKLADVLDA